MGALLSRSGQVLGRSVGASEAASFSTLLPSSYGGELCAGGGGRGERPAPSVGPQSCPCFPDPLYVPLPPLSCDMSRSVSPLVVSWGQMTPVPLLPSLYSSLPPHGSECPVSPGAGQGFRVVSQGPQRRWEWAGWAPEVVGTLISKFLGMATWGQ